MLKKKIAVGILLAILLIAVSIISVAAISHRDSGEVKEEIPETTLPEKNDSQLLYEVYIDGRFSCSVSDVRDVFSASDKIESEMSEKLGYAYLISNDLNVEMVAVRKEGETVSSEKVEDLITKELSRLYSECYAFYVGDNIIGYSSVSNKEELEILAVDIIKYISAYDPAHAAASNIYVAPDFTYRSRIVTGTDDIRNALSAKDAFENKDDLDETIANIIESIDQAIMFGSTAETLENVETELVVTSIRRIETEVVAYQRLRLPDVECTCSACKKSITLLGDDDPDEIHQKGKDGKCTVEYEDIYIGDELSHSVRVDGSEHVTVAPVDEITIYGTQSTTASGVMIWPTVGWITSEYGKRKAEFVGMSTYHKGIDISTSRKTKIVAADAGVVEFAGWHSGGFGYCVIIDHENGIKTLYAHMYRKPEVKVGERVYQGEFLGGQGMTGSAGGIHLHFEVIKDGDRINPRKYLPKGYPPVAW